MQVNYNDNYIVNCLEQTGGFDTTGNHRLYPSELIYPNGSEFNFTHEKYYRTALYVYNPISTNQLNFKFDNDNGLKRLKTIKNVYGGKREYEYIGGANEVSIYMNPTDGNKIMSNAVNVEYFGQGRDVFFVNMVLNKKVYNKTDLISKVDWSYLYDYHNRDNYKVDPINPQDDYTTNIKTSNPSGKEIYYTPQNRQIKYLYKDYKLKQNSNKSEYPDWEGHSKLISALEYLTDTINFFKKTTYLFSGGTFLDTAIINNYANTAEKRTSFRYDLFSLDSRIEQNYNPVKKTVKIDPFGQKTEILNDFIYKTSRHYALGLYNPRGSQRYDSTYYYNIQLPVSKKIFNINGGLLYKDSSFYYYQNGSNGYMGQIYLSRQFDMDAESSDYQDTRYYYNHNDTLGVCLYPGTTSVPGNEGNLKQVINPQGRIVNYYYRLFAPLADSLTVSGPLLKAKYLMLDGTVKDTAIDLADSRMSGIIQSEAQSGIYTYSFNKYNERGFPKFVFSNDRFITQAYYDNSGRISQITSPGDFGRDSVIIKADTLYNVVDTLLKADLISIYDFVHSSTIFYQKYDNLCSVISYFGNMDNDFVLISHDPGGPPDNMDIKEQEDKTPADSVVKKLPLIRFNHNQFFRSLTGINFAEFILYPKTFTHKTNNDTSISKTRFKITLLNQIYENDSAHQIIFNPTALSYKYNIFAPWVDTGGCTPYFRNSFDITNLLSPHILQNGDSVVGVQLQVVPWGDYIDMPSINYFMGLYQGSFCQSFQNWCDSVSPLLHVQGVVKRIKIDTIYKSITYTKKYNYDDSQAMVEVLNKYGNNQPEGKKQQYFDGFYRPSQSRIYLTDTKFDSISQSYNYLGLKLEDKDGKENKTHYSYDNLLNLSRTDNADNSYRLTSDTFQTNFETSYGMYYGLINKKEYTDEEGNQSQKYSDAAGNLIRDVRIYLNTQGQTDYIFTDYKYDALYRVVQVKTPEGKQIYYTYDGYGRQKRRETPDNGQVNMKYNNDNSLRFSQDNTQLHRDESRPSRYYTFHGYDGQNRMVYSGEIHDLTGAQGFDNLDPMQHYSFENYNEHPDNFLLVNVYDTLSYQAAGIFTPPTDYYDKSNNTAGRLIATAYRTLYSDGWSYKYYRYDAWGDICRTYSTTDTTVNKFTGKERDTETGYDYFGARYYDSRISVWLSPDPLFEKHLQWSPYNYVLRNPFVLIDPDGRQVNVKSLTQEHRNAIIQDLLIITGYTFQMNSDGYLKIDNSKEVSGGSEIGRKLAKEIDSYDKSVIQVVEHSCTYRSSFYDGNNGGISLNPLEIESNTNPDNVMNGLNIHTFGWGMVFLHELLHSKFKGWDPDDKNLPQGTIGDIEKFLNRIRVQLGKDWGQIQTHTAYRQTIDGTEYGIIPFSKEVIKALESYEFKTKEKYIKSEILIDFEK